jgi:hypothetical protein
MLHANCLQHRFPRDSLYISTTYLFTAMLPRFPSSSTSPPAPSSNSSTSTEDKKSTSTPSGTKSKLGSQDSQIFSGLSRISQTPKQAPSSAENWSMEAWNEQHKRQADIRTVSTLMALKSKATEANLATAKKTLERAKTLSASDSAAGHFTSNPLNDFASNSVSVFEDRAKGEMEHLENKLTSLNKAVLNVGQLSNDELQKYIDKEGRK